jgi:hypothetical protein
MIKQRVFVLFLCAAACGLLWAEGQMDRTSTGVKIKTFSIYVAREMDNYPPNGTFLGK